MKNIIHWCQPKRRWTSHTYKACAKAETIMVIGNWHTEVKPNRRSNPKGWVVTDHTNVIYNPSEEMLSTINKKERLLYNKDNVAFNVDRGSALLFDKDGCYLLEGKPDEERNDRYKV